MNTFDNAGGFDDEAILRYVGMRNTWGGDIPFYLEPEDRRHHLYCVGKTGSGKTTLLRNLILQDIYAGAGVGVIDPHGDLAHDILDHIPASRTDDVVYFNPGDTEYPIGFNLFQNVPMSQRHRIASGIVGAMKNIWHDSWGPRMEYILYAAVAALLDCNDTSLLGIPRMLADRVYRRWVVKQVKDPVVQSFWINEFERYDARFRQEAIAPIQNKVGQLLMSRPIRNVLGQVRRKIDPRFMMDRGRLFIANLSKGMLGEDKANLLGSLLVTSFEQAAIERTELPEAKRRDFHLYIDEFQSFSTESFISILSEARKYRLCLTLSHQYLDQLRESVRQAVFGNVGSFISFRIGEKDAKVLAEEYGYGYDPERFSSLDNFHVLAKCLAGGRYGVPFSGRTLPPLDLPGGRRPILLRRSREKYASRRGVIEGKIDRWMKRRLR